MPPSRASSQPRDLTQVSHMAGGTLTPCQNSIKAYIIKYIWVFTYTYLQVEINRQTDRHYVVV